MKVAHPTDSDKLEQNHVMLFSIIPFKISDNFSVGKFQLDDLSNWKWIPLMFTNYFQNSDHRFLSPSETMLSRRPKVLDIFMNDKLVIYSAVSLLLNLTNCILPAILSI